MTYDIRKFKVGYSRSDLDAERELRRIELGARLEPSRDTYESIVRNYWLGDRCPEVCIRRMSFDNYLKEMSSGGTDKSATSN